jgi:hypothetical protein
MLMERALYFSRRMPGNGRGCLCGFTFGRWSWCIVHIGFSKRAAVSLVGQSMATYAVWVVKSTQGSQFNLFE